MMPNSWKLQCEQLNTLEFDLQEIQKENETYYSLLREALPPGPARSEKQ